METKIKSEYLTLFNYYSEVCSINARQKNDYYDDIVLFIENYNKTHTRFNCLLYPQQIFIDITKNNVVTPEKIMTIRVCMDFVRIIHHNSILNERSLENSIKNFKKFENYLNNAKRLCFSYDKMLNVLKNNSKQLFDKYISIIKRTETQIKIPFETQMEKQIENPKTEKQFSDVLKLYENQYTKEFLNDFFNWWTQPNTLNGKPRFLIKNFDLEERLELWQRTSYKQNKIKVEEKQKIDSPEPKTKKISLFDLFVSVVNKIVEKFNSVKKLRLNRRFQRLRKAITKKNLKLIDIEKKLKNK